MKDWMWILGVALAIGLGLGLGVCNLFLFGEEASSSVAWHTHGGL